MSAANGVLRFEPAGSYLTAIDGSEVDGDDEPDWPRAEGIVERDDEKAERFTITHPRTGQRIVIDFSDEEKPSRVLP